MKYSGREGASLPFERRAFSECCPSLQDDMTSTGEVADQGHTGGQVCS